MKRNEPNNCSACFVQNCDCTCMVCVNAQERNNKLSPMELFRLNYDASRETDVLKKERENAPNQDTTQS